MNVSFVVDGGSNSDAPCWDEHIPYAVILLRNASPHVTLLSSIVRVKDFRSKNHLLHVQRM